MFKPRSDREIVKKELEEGADVLDLGSGKGHQAKGLEEELGCKVTRVDIEDSDEYGKDVVVYDGHTVSYPNDYFSYSVCMFVLHHVPNKFEILSELKRVTQKKVVILEDGAGKLSGLWEKIHNIQYKLTWGNGSKVEFFSPKEWETIANYFFNDYSIDTYLGSMGWLRGLLKRICLVGKDILWGE